MLCVLWVQTAYNDTHPPLKSHSGSTALNIPCALPVHRPLSPWQPLTSSLSPGLGLLLKVVVGVTWGVTWGVTVQSASFHWVGSPSPSSHA